MKKFVISLILAVIISFSVTGITFAESVTKSVTSQDDGTDPITPASWSNYTPNKEGYLNVSVSGTWVATVHLQRNFENGAAGSWLDVDSWTSNVEASVSDKRIGVLYRLFCKTGNFTSGTIVMLLNY